MRASFGRWALVGVGTSLLAVTVLLAAPGDARAADLEPELGGVATLDAPGEHWFVGIGFFGGGSIFDADSGEMRGKLNLSRFTSAVVLDRERQRFYIPGSYYSRGSYGERSDVLVINDLENLAPVAEVAVPVKLAAVFHRGVINPVGEKFIGLYNMTPAMSVSIVDVERSRFVGELSTAGCGFVYPLSERRFMQLCGDGTVQVIGLDQGGTETSRERSEPFFDIDEDPVFDLAVKTPYGWLLVSFEGRVFQVSVDDEIRVSEPWSILTEEDAEDDWRVGGDQPFAYNGQTGMLFTLMHQGEPDTHEDPGTEIWAFDVGTQRRGYRLTLAEPSPAIDVSQDAEPLLYVVSGEPAQVHVHQAVTGRLLRSIPEVGSINRIQAL